MQLNRAFRQRMQMGRVSSHLICRVLHVSHPLLTLWEKFRFRGRLEFDFGFLSTGHIFVVGLAFSLLEFEELEFVGEALSKMIKLCAAIL